MRSRGVGCFDRLISKSNRNDASITITEKDGRREHGCASILLANA